jgi:voltage-gated potassium channel
MKLRKRLKLSKHQLAIIKIIFLYLAFYGLSSILLYLLEHGLNERCQTIFDAFWLNIVFLFSGFEDFGPKTSAGKILSLISFAVGLATITIITGKIASTFVLNILKEGKMNNKLSGHIAICNWNDGGDKIVKEIHSPIADPEVNIVILTGSEVPEEQLRHSPEYEKVFFVRCDPSLHSSLKASRIAEAKSVIILADPDSPDPDATTAMIALAVSKLCPAEKRPHIIAESINHRKMEHLADAGVDEIVCAGDFEYGIIAQCSLIGKYGRLSEVYRQLLTYSEDTNEFYIIPPDNVPRTLIGKSFADACVDFSKKRNSENPAILIGVVRNGQIMLNPRQRDNRNAQAELDTIQENDGLIVIAFEEPDLSKLFG